MKDLTIKEFKSKLGEVLELDLDSLKLVARSGGGIRLWCDSYLILDFRHSEIRKIVALKNDK